MSPLYYVSSKLKHRDMWLSEGLTYVSSWIEDDTKVQGAERLSPMWDQYRADLRWAQAFALYLEPGEVPKGALVELGMAFQLGIPIYIIWSGTMDELVAVLGTIPYHDSVTLLSSVDELPR